MTARAAITVVLGAALVAAGCRHHPTARPRDGSGDVAARDVGTRDVGARDLVDADSIRVDSMGDGIDDAAHDGLEDAASDSPHDQRGIESIPIALAPKQEDGTLAGDARCTTGIVVSGGAAAPAALVSSLRTNATSWQVAASTGGLNKKARVICVSGAYQAKISRSAVGSSSAQCSNSVLLGADYSCIGGQIVAAWPSALTKFSLTCAGGTAQIRAVCLSDYAGTVTAGTPGAKAATSTAKCTTGFAVGGGCETFGSMVFGSIPWKDATNTGWQCETDSKASVIAHVLCASL